MNTPYFHFLQQNFKTYLEHLQADTPAQWGIMTAQHMVEHLGFLIAFSNGKITYKSPESTDTLSQRKTYFFAADKPMPRHIKMQELPPNTLKPLRFDNIELARAKTIAQLDLFWNFFDTNPHSTPLHPVLGNLNFEEWVQFHARHIRHHFAQFGLMKADYNFVKADGNDSI